MRYLGTLWSQFGNKAQEKFVQALDSAPVRNDRPNLVILEHRHPRKGGDECRMQTGSIVGATPIVMLSVMARPLRSVLQQLSNTSVERQERPSGQRRQRQRFSTPFRSAGKAREAPRCETARRREEDTTALRAPALSG